MGSSVESYGPGNSRRPQKRTGHRPGENPQMIKKKKNFSKAPVDQITLPSEYNKLPEWQIRMAILHAESHVEDVLGIKPGSKGYAAKIQKEAIHYLKEGIEESLTAHMTDGDNPTSPKAIEGFLKQPVFSVEGTFLKRLPEQAEKEHFARLFRSSINTLANVFNSVALRLRPDSYVYPKGGSR